VCEIGGGNGSGGGLRGEALLDQVFDLRPEVGIALALHMAGSEDSVPPRGAGAGNGSFLVIHEVIAQNFSSGGIGRSDLAATVDDAVDLVKIYGFGDIVGNDGIVLPQFGDTIHLDGQENGYAFVAQIAGEQYGGGCSPTVAEEDDAGVSFFLGGKDAVVISVEQTNDGVIGLFSAAVFEDLNISALGEGLADALCELNRAVVRVIRTYETADEADHDIGRSSRGVRNGGIPGASERGNCGSQDCEGNEPGAKWCGARQQRTPNFYSIR